MKYAPRVPGAERPVEKCRSVIARPSATVATKVHQIPLTGIGGGNQQKSRPTKDKMEIDITKYDPVISGILSKLKVKKQDREDMTQECYVALLEKRKHLERGIELGTAASFAASICRSRITDIWRKNNQQQPGHKTKPDLRFDSLTDPRVHRKAIKIIDPNADIGWEATSWELDDALFSLPFDEFRVLYEIFVESKTQDQVAQSLGITPRMVGTRQQKGIEGLKKYFGVAS